MEELVQITKKLTVQDSPSQTKKFSPLECNSIVEQFQQCDNMAINLIVEFINGKLKSPRNLIREI